MTTSRFLIDNWQFRQIPSPSLASHLQLPWLPAQVPGFVHLDLMRAGVIDDPFRRMNEAGVWWIDEADWEYRTTFQMDSMPDSDAYLVFHGLDTISEIVLNDEVIAHTDNMFTEHRVLATDRLKSGENTLLIRFRSAMRIGEERKEAWDAQFTDKTLYQWDNYADREFVRKAQYMYGWDWGPVLRSCGIWQPVELLVVETARIADWKHEVAFAEDGKSAKVLVTAFVERSRKAANKSLELTVKLGEASGTATVPALAGGGRQAISVELTVDNPVRWEPNNGDGNKPHLYDVELILSSDGQTAASRRARIGLRTFELIREPDADGKGESFKFRVNGRDTFAKGANWIPTDSFITRLNNASAFSGVPQAPDATGVDRVEQLVLMAKDAGMNMLRVWGGGFYESDRFYELCDEHGLLVWQDFMYACGYYPDSEEYAEAARTEAVAAVRRLRNHASLVLWCGNNENYTMWESGWSGLKMPRFFGKDLYEKVLPKVIAEESPAHAYWPSSPYGGDYANSPNAGDVHNWAVWHGVGDWKNYTADLSRFCSEFGFASACGMKTWNKTLDPQDTDPYGPAVQWHDKTRKGYETYLGMVDLHFPKSVTLEDLTYNTQINQAEALKYGIEHYRRIKGRCWGTLFWQLNDCWPVQSWAVIDSEIEPKAAYYAMKRGFYAPLLVSLYRPAGAAEVEVHVISDLAREQKAHLTVALKTFDGEQLDQADRELVLAANSADKVTTLSLERTAGHEKACYVAVELRADGSDGALLSENILLLDEPKDIPFAAPDLSWDISESGADHLKLSLTAKRFAPYVWLRAGDEQGLFSDNFFHLQPGETKQIEVRKTEGAATVEALRAALSIRTL